jgi:shikimate kinase
VFDLVYNPLRTSLILQAENKNIKAVNGLMMLVHQAVVANGLFNNTTHSKDLTNTIYKELLLNQLNLVLIGMPMSGKTYYTRELSSIYHKEMFDIDRQIEYTQEKSISEIFSTLGESEFRRIEKNAIIEISKQLNKAISTGGGVILDPQNIKYLKHNGVILFLDMSLNDLKKCNPKQRPLLQDPKNLEILFNQRYDLYKKYCDIRIKKRGFKQKETLKQIEVKLNEYIST